MHGAVGTLIAFATGPDTVALDGEGRNSPFTSALLKHLATPGLHVSLMMQRVRADVVQHDAQQAGALGSFFVDWRRDFGALSLDSQYLQAMSVPAVQNAKLVSGH